MNQNFTFKSVLLALLVMISCAAKAETVSYQTDNGFIYEIDLETQEAALSRYNGNATNVVIPEKIAYEGKEYKVTSLGDRCFFSCSSLASIAIPSSVTSLGGECFSRCRSLASIDIPSSVTSLGDDCFSGCSSLASIDIPSSVTSLGAGCFWRCTSLVSIEIPSSVTSIGNCCFADCTSLVSIEIPSSVTSIGDYCFYNCYSLASIAIPSSVTSLGYRCFSYCSSLKTVICRMENVESESGDLFNGTPIEEAVLYVLKTLLATYQNITPWSSFGTILPLTEEVELGISDTSKPVFSFRSDDGSVVLSGLADGTPVSYYSVDGRLLGRTSVDNGSASFSVKPNSIVTVKAGKQSFKVCVK